MYKRQACKHAGLHGALDALVDGADELFRDGAANDGVDELIALTCFVRLDFDLDVTVLAFTAGLTRVLGVLVGGTADGLAVGNLRGCLLYTSRCAEKHRGRNGH